MIPGRTRNVRIGAEAAYLPPRSPISVSATMLVSVLLHVGFFAAFAMSTTSRSPVGMDARATTITIALVAAPQPATEKVEKTVEVFDFKEVPKAVPVTRDPPQRKPETKTKTRTRTTSERSLTSLLPKTDIASHGEAALSSLALETREQGAAAYGRLVWKKIAENKPAGLHRKGQVDVRFTVTPSGGVSQIVVLHSSGGRVLEKLARDTLERAVPFATPPAGLSAEELTFVIPLRFS